MSASPHLEKPLRVCMVTDCYPPSVGGIESHVYALSRELARLGHHVTVVTHKEMKPRRARAYAAPCLRGVEIVRLRGLTVRLPDGSDPAADLSMIPQMARLLRERDFDVVHGHTVESPFVLALMRRAEKRGLPTVITKHSMVERPRRPPVIGGMMRALMVKIVDQFSAYIAVSEPAAEELRSSKAQSFVVRNAIDINLFRPDPALRAATRAALGYQDEHVVVGFLSRFVLSKGLLDLAEIGARIARGDSRLRFLLVGDGPLRLRVERRIRQAGMEDRFRLVGPQAWERTPAYLNAMDVFAFPSQSEGFGLALLEAMACGVPAVTTDRSGTQDVVQNGRTAFMAHSLAEFEQTLRLLIADAELRRRTGDAARDSVVCSQSWAAVARQTADVYRQVMCSHGKAAP